MAGLGSQSLDSSHRDSALPNSCWTESQWCRLVCIRDDACRGLMDSRCCGLAADKATSDIYMALAYRWAGFESTAVGYCLSQTRRVATWLFIPMTMGPDP